jgi:hypothetical protein
VDLSEVSTGRACVKQEVHVMEIVQAVWLYDGMIAIIDSDL